MISRVSSEVSVSAWMGWGLGSGRKVRVKGLDLDSGPTP